MLDVDKQTPSSRPVQPETYGKSLTQWIHQLVDNSQLRVQSRLRGNTLHILLEGPTCPEATSLLPRLKQAFAKTPSAVLLPLDAPPIYRVIVYGRIIAQNKPNWTKSFDINLPEPPPSHESDDSNPPTQPPIAVEAPQPASAVLISPLELARQGQPAAIARYLSDQFTELGVAVRAKIDQATEEREADNRSASQPTAPLKRLFIRCESAYSPDPSLLAEPIAQRLRELELEGFRDAVVFGQVRGETRPEWALRVDLTPPNTILREWARWGDVQAIAHLLNLTLNPQAIEVSALLKEATLHLTCRSTNSAGPDKAQTITAIVPLLQSLSPQGIQGATLYGVQPTVSSASSQAALTNAVLPDTPLWIDWLTLAAATEPTLAAPTFELAEQGNLEAIGFLLSRLLNPDLKTKLATGGLRVQIRQKGDLLHIMCDAPICPQQKQVGPAIVRCLQPLQIPHVAGVRVYGRRAGQKQPLWSYGADFAARKRLVLEVTPEFAASDAYVRELLEPAGALALRPEGPATQLGTTLKHVWDGAIQGIQRSLIRSQLFVPLESTSVSPLAPANEQQSLKQTEDQGLPVALVWGAVGLLLVIQSDWLLGRWIQTVHAPLAQPEAQVSAPVPVPSPEAQPAARPQLPNLSLQKNKPTDQEAFNASGFTQPGTTTIGQAAAKDKPEPGTASLQASPLQPQANLSSGGSNAYPTFNSRQLDERLVLYRQYLERNGPPDVLVIGSSRALRGVDPVALKAALTEQGYQDLKVFNFGINGATAQVVDLVVRQFLPQEALPKLILWADGARAFNSGRTDITYNGIVASQGYRTLIAGKPPIPGTLTAQAPIPATPGASDSPASVTEESPTSPSAGSYQALNQELDKFLGRISMVYSQRDRLKTQLRDTVASLLPTHHLGLPGGGAIALQDLSDATSPAASAANSPQSVLSEKQNPIDIDGFMPLPNRFNPATYYQKYSRVPGDYDSDYESFVLEGEQNEALAALAQFAQARQMALVFVNLPLTNDYLDPTRKRYEEQFQQHMLQQATQLGFTYRDLSQALADQPDYFSDPSHLNRYGGYAVSQRLAGDVMVPWNLTRK